MCPSATKVKKINQASSDPSSNWAKARHAWVKQLAVRFGMLDPTKNCFEYNMNRITAENADDSVLNILIVPGNQAELQPLLDLDGQVIPTYYDPRKLTRLHRDQIAW